MDYNGQDLTIAGVYAAKGLAVGSIESGIAACIKGEDVFWGSVIGGVTGAIEGFFDGICEGIFVVDEALEILGAGVAAFVGEMIQIAVDGEKFNLVDCCSEFVSGIMTSLSSLLLDKTIATWVANSVNDFIKYAADLFGDVLEEND